MTRGFACTSTTATATMAELDLNMLLACLVATVQTVALALHMMLRGRCCLHDLLRLQCQAKLWWL